MRDKTAEQRVVGRIDDRIRIQTGNISFPEREAVLLGKFVDVHHAALFRFGREKPVLQFQKTRRDGVGQALVQKSPDQIALDLVRITERRYFVPLFQ